MELPAGLREARFVERPNRFLLRCELAAHQENGQPAPTPPGLREPPHGSGPRVVDVHMADPGRLNELLLPGRRVWIRYAASPTRRTDWSAVLVEAPHGNGLVSVDTTLPNRLVRRALEAHALEELAGWSLLRPEFTLGRSRIDFLLACDHRQLALEVKSVTLVGDDGVARFPDAVTARGARHVRELAAVARRPGWEAAILFVLQRDDAHRIEAARSIDPAFADALAEAEEAGVRVLGRRCQVSRQSLVLGDAVPAS